MNVLVEKNDMNTSEKMMDSFTNSREFVMYYHTELRNVGLYTSLSLAGLGALRSLGKIDKSNLIHNKFKFMFFSLFVLVFLSISLILSYSLMTNVQYVINNKNSSFEIRAEYEYIPTAVFSINLVGLLIGVVICIEKLFFL